MNRDHFLFALIGLLIGFLAGYLLQEYFVLQQPPRLVPGEVPGSVARAPGPGGGTAGAPRASAPGADAATTGGPAMEEVQALQQRLAANPQDADAALGLANMNFEIANWSRAAELYRQYLELRPEAPNRADVLSDLGVCLRNQGQPREALDLFDQAQDLQPAHWQSRFNEVIVLAIDLQEFQRAEEVLEELRSLQPGNPDVQELAREVARLRAAA